MRHFLKNEALKASFGTARMDWVSTALQDRTVIRPNAADIAGLIQPSDLAGRELRMTLLSDCYIITKYHTIKLHGL